MKSVINRKIYDTETATLIATDHYWDGHNFERSGRNLYLYRTPRNAYFLHYSTMWEGERDHITPITLGEAIKTYETLPEHREEFTSAFPNTPIEPA